MTARHPTPSQSPADAARLRVHAGVGESTSPVARAHPRHSTMGPRRRWDRISRWFVEHVMTLRNRGQRGPNDDPMTVISEGRPSFESVYEAHYRNVYRYVLLRAQRTDVDEVVAETLCRQARSRRSVRSASPSRRCPHGSFRLMARRGPVPRRRTGPGRSTTTSPDRRRTSWTITAPD